MSRRSPVQQPAEAPHPRPLVLTAHQPLFDDLLRLAAAAGAEVQAVPDAGAARGSWSTAPLVVVGSDQVAGLLRLDLPRRLGVVLVGLDFDDADIWRQAVEIGAEHVVFLPDAEGWLVDRFADLVEGAPGAGLVIGIVGGRGGAGATVLAASLALAGTRRGLATMLLDADPFGGGIDLVLGAEGAHGLRWPDLAGTRGRVSGAALRDALPDPHGLTVLSWDRGEALTIPVDAVRTVLGAARRTYDLVVVDLPRRVDETVEEVLSRCHRTFLVVPAEVRAVAAAARVAAGVSLAAGDVRLVVRGPSPTGIMAAEVADALGLPVAAEMAPEPGLDRALDAGVAPGRGSRSPLAACCARLLDGVLADRPAA